MAIAGKPDLINSLPASYGISEFYLNLFLPRFPRPIRITPNKNKATVSEFGISSLLSRNQAAVINEAGIIDIKTGFIIVSIDVKF